MLEFKTLSLEDKTWVDELVKSEGCYSAGYSFGTIYIWNSNYRHLVARHGDRMIEKLRYSSEAAYTAPIGSGSVLPALDALREYCDSRGQQLILRGVTQRQMDSLEKECPGRFEYSEDVDFADYISLA